MNPKWKMMFYVANDDFVRETDVSACDDDVWIQAKACGDGCDVGDTTVWYVDSDDLEVGDVPSSS